jgi:hypothetical protein
VSSLNSTHLHSLWFLRIGYENFIVSNTLNLKWVKTIGYQFIIPANTTYEFIIHAALIDEKNIPKCNQISIPTVHMQ